MKSPDWFSIWHYLCYRECLFVNRSLLVCFAPFCSIGSLFFLTQYYTVRITMILSSCVLFVCVCVLYNVCMYVNMGPHPRRSEDNLGCRLSPPTLFEAESLLFTIASASPHLLGTLLCFLFHSVSMGVVDISCHVCLYGFWDFKLRS